MTANRAGGRAAIVGAGIAGLSVAWFLQEEGFQVTVYDARGVAGGASAGNAGWICPAMVAPLPEPSVLRYGMASVLRPGSPVRIPLAAVPVTWRFLAAFAANCTRRRWLAGVSSYAPLNAQTLPSYDALAQAGVAATMQNSGVIRSRPGGQVPGGLTAGLIAPVPDHREQPGDRVRPRDAPAEHVTVDVRWDDQAGRPVSCRLAGAGPEPPMPARAQRAEEERALPRATPVDLALIPRPGLSVPGQRHPQIQRDPAKLAPLPCPAAARHGAPHPRRPGNNGHDSTLRATSDMPWTPYTTAMTVSAIDQAWPAAAAQPCVRVLWLSADLFTPPGNHCSLAKILSIASAPMVITGRIWWR